MKKLVMILTAVLAMAFSSMCMAYDGGDLNKQQAACEKMLQAFSQTAEVPAYADVSKGMDVSLKEKFTAETYAELQKQVKERFGRVKEIKFYSFQRFDEMDQIVYMTSFSKEKLVSVTALFNKDNKMTSFALNVVNTEAAAQEAEQK